MKRIALFAVVFGTVAGCGSDVETPKTPEVAPDYGAEGAKEDSRTAPATIVDVVLGEVQTTTFTAQATYRGFRFNGAAGQRVDLFVDGLRNLDTVLHVYRVSPATGRPTGRALASNDDTLAPGWALSPSRAFNTLSSSVAALELPETGRFILLATTYNQRGRGSAEVTIKAMRGGESCGSRGLAQCAAGLYCDHPPGADCGRADLPGTCTSPPEACSAESSPVCGCDGQTYDNACAASAARVSVASAGACAPAAGAAGASCGSRGLAQCGAGLYCGYPPAANCGRSDAPGTCRSAPGRCSNE